MLTNPLAFSCILIIKILRISGCFSDIIRNLYHMVYVNSLYTSRCILEITYNDCFIQNVKNRKTYFLISTEIDLNLFLSRELNAEQMHKVITNYKLDHVTKLRISRQEHQTDKTRSQIFSKRHHKRLPHL